MEQQTPARKLLEREVKRIALTRMEDAARTLEQFENVIAQWDHLDENRERKERYHEDLHTTPLLEWGSLRFEGAIIPQPFDHAFWRQLLIGSFLDVIFDCPHEVHEQTASRSASQFVGELSDNQKEVFYYWAIRLYSPQRIAKIRGQSDRNIRKVYANLIKELRAKMYMRLAPRYDMDLPLTFAQKEFVKTYREELRKEQAALDEKSGR